MSREGFVDDGIFDWTGMKLGLRGFDAMTPEKSNKESTHVRVLGKKAMTNPRMTCNQTLDVEIQRGLRAFGGDRTTAIEKRFYVKVQSKEGAKRLVHGGNPLSA